MNRWPRIPLGLRLFFLYFILISITAYTTSMSVVQELKPTVRQVTEETLVDMVNLLAVMVEDDVVNGSMSESRFFHLLATYGLRDPQSSIWKVNKKTMNHRIYITNKQGIVIADSWQEAVGEDYSQWNDVYLTLQGKYGARSTKQDPKDPLSSVMHVAAPIYNNQEIIGSVTVAKSNRSIQPFIDLSKRNVLLWMLCMSGLVLIVGGLFAWRTHSALHKLENYAMRLGEGEEAEKPEFRIFYEYGILSDALEEMRNQLDGKQYVEEYVETLTHELKSPLSAIKGASEILQMPLTEEKRKRFAHNVERESDRMQSLIDKLLELARLEKQPQLKQLEPIHLEAVLNEICFASDARLSVKEATCTVVSNHDIVILGDPFLFKQALFNLMDNALDFVNNKGVIEWQLTQKEMNVMISIHNTGSHIPDYAMERVTERFYSLTRGNGLKSTGLGLNFVDQVVKLHHGSLQIKNTQEGVRVTLQVPTP